MDAVQTIISVVSGSLAGACASALYSRIFHWRNLRTQFHPKLNNIAGAYTIRFDDDETGRYLTSFVGQVPTQTDKAFVNSRADFIQELAQYNELREARKLRRVLLANTNPSHIPTGRPLTRDLKPEYDAIMKCLGSVQDKLRL